MWHPLTFPQTLWTTLLRRTIFIGIEVEGKQGTLGSPLPCETVYSRNRTATQGRGGARVVLREREKRNLLFLAVKSPTCTTISKVSTVFAEVWETREEGCSSPWGVEVSKGPCSTTAGRNEGVRSTFPEPSSPPGLAIRLRTNKCVSIFLFIVTVCLLEGRSESPTWSACLILLITVSPPSPHGSGPGLAHNAV